MFTAGIGVSEPVISISSYSLVSLFVGGSDSPASCLLVPKSMILDHAGNMQYFDSYLMKWSKSSKFSKSSTLNWIRFPFL
jgi:hypothetical protein